MKATKKVLGSLEKCYALTSYEYGDEKYVMIAAEKLDEIDVFTYEGEKVTSIYGGNGGVMTMQQDPGSDKLLATQKFFSPNNSAEAMIIYFTREGEKWTPHKLCDLPFVHRFGVMTDHGKKYLIACSLKSAHAFKDDWTCPGRVWVAELPEDLTTITDENPLKLTPLLSGLYKNHGFARLVEDGKEYALVGTENGIYRVDPPRSEEGEWTCELLLETPTSDMLYMDFDGDGEKELLVLSPFHGDTVTIWKKDGETFRQVYEYPTKLPFIHAIWGKELNGVPYGFVGNRQEEMNLLAFYYDREAGKYVVDELDRGSGAANVMFYELNGEPKLLAANRETDEIAVYSLED